MWNEYYMEFEAVPSLALGTLASHYQPIVSVRRKAIVGYEALARATDLNGQPIRPDILFANARRNGHALELDRRCQHLAISGFVEQAPTGDSILSVNMDASHFAGHTETPAILALMEEQGLGPGRLMVEICEDAVHSQRQLENFVSICRELGVLVAIDDLGQKHSNLDRIVSLRPDLLKLDRTLIHDVHNDATRRNLVRSLVKMAVGGGSLVLAEGVESWEEALELMELGVDLFQGFYFAKPQARLADARSIAPRIDVLGKTFATIRMEGVRRTRQKVADLREYGNRAMEILANVNADNQNRSLDAVAGLFAHCECIYLLNQWGEQLSPTRFPPTRSVHPRSLLFEPARVGDDHSQRDYFYALPSWEETLGSGNGAYLTEEYTSMATGSRCRTFSCWYRDAYGEPCVLCVDLVEDAR